MFDISFLTVVEIYNSIRPFFKITRENDDQKINKITSAYFLTEKRHIARLIAQRCRLLHMQEKKFFPAVYFSTTQDLT